MRSEAPAEILFEGGRGGSVPPHVTVVVSLFEYDMYVEEALESVREQTLAALDLVVVDDRSEDGSAALVRRWLERHARRFERARLLRHRENLGPAASRNSAVKAARTGAVFVLDADDSIYPRCLERLWSALQASGAAFAYPYMELFGRRQGIVNLEPWDPSRLRSRPIVNVTALLRKSLWTRIGGYDEDPELVGAEDHDFWLRAAAAGEWGIQVPEMLARYRVHEASTGSTLLTPVEIDVFWDRLFLKHPGIYLSRGCPMSAEPRWTSVAHAIDDIVVRPGSVQVRGWISSPPADDAQPLSIVARSRGGLRRFEGRREGRRHSGAGGVVFSARFAKTELAHGEHSIGIMIGEPPLERAVLTDARVSLRGAPRAAGPKAYILLYHRVAESEGGDPHGLSVSPDAFRAQMEWLKQEFPVVSLSDLCSDLERGQIREGAVAVTFDDGYACNLRTAVPILDALDLPATFLVTAAMVGDEGEFLSDELWHVLRFNSAVARVPLRLHFQGTDHCWAPPHNTADYHQIFHLLRLLPRQEQARGRAALREQTGFAAEPSPNRAFDQRELRTLSLSRRLDVGSHGLTHATLAREEREIEEEEIARSKEVLERAVAREVWSFAYPYGGSGDYTFRTASTVERTGYRCALTAQASAVCAASDPYRLPRLTVGDWTPKVLSRRLSRLRPG